MTCKHLGGKHATIREHDVHRCRLLIDCTLQPSGLRTITGLQMPDCSSCPHFAENEQPKPQGKFCYFTGSNLPTEPPIVATMIRSARAVGVSEDFHVFCTRDVDGAINHGASFAFDQYMFKVELLKQLADLPYEYFVWLDPDNYFVRHPGDFSELLRDEPIWVSMEGDLAAPDAQKNWWGIGANPQQGSLVEVMRSFGVATPSVWNTNAGAFIVRREAIESFAEEMYRVKNGLVARGFSGVTEEPPLAIVGQTMVSHPENNTFENHKHIWTSDWISAAGGGRTLPDGKPFEHKDWASQKPMGSVNPAIVHVMRGKTLMAASAANPVDGDYLTCPHRGRPIEQLSCDCSIDREIYRCGKRGLCLKRLPPGTVQESFPQLNGVAVCHGCDAWRS